MDKLCDKAGLPKSSKKVRCTILTIMMVSVLVGLILISHVLFIRQNWINVHIVPHSHDDVGWLRNPEDYYEFYVKYILDHVILELQRSSERRFVFVETYFFWKWWEEQSDAVREIVKCLIKNNQFEIVGGGWCMSDEAVTYYQSFIDQSTWGFRRLNDTFGSTTCPTVAWQIDTFGHSKGIASLLAQMGFSSFFFARIDYTERQYRKKNKQMEFIWRANENLGESSSIFTSIFYNHYSSPEGFDFETHAAQEEIEYEAFVKYARNHAKYFKTNHILVPMGDDFRFFNARKYFYKLDMLISFFRENKNWKLNVFYSTPTIYINSLQSADVRWPVKRGDFFPYLSEDSSYWTGYFTSRPTLKYFERISNNFLQICKQLLVLAETGKKHFEELTTLREAVGVLQHHDAITGTSKEQVTNHYSKLLHAGIKACEMPVNEALWKLSEPRVQNQDKPFYKPLYKSCLFLNISVCDVTEEASRFIVTIYNSLSFKVDHYVRIPVQGKQYCVFNSQGFQVEVQMVAIPMSVRRIPGRRSIAKSEIVFKATNLPALGFKSFYVFLNDAANERCERMTIKRKKKDKTTFRSNVKLIFDSETETLSGIRSKTCNASLSQSIKYYQSSRELSGAYLFRPASEATFDTGSKSRTTLLSNGRLVKEYEQLFSDWASQIIRVYKEENYVEFEWLVGPIPTQDYMGKEIVSVYFSNIKNKNVFYTDVNGMEMEKRVRDYRPLSKVMEKVSGNYYPVTSMISIKDDTDQMVVVIDRPQGGSSLHSGQIELMIHRRLCYDDKKGVSEALNETAYGVGLVARGRHWLLYGENRFLFEQNAKLFSQMRHSEPWLFFLDASHLPFESWSTNYITEFSGLSAYLPRNVRILTLEPWTQDTVLLRLEHIFEKIPSSRLANAPAKIKLQDLFKNFEIIEARETTLGADRWISDSKRLKWRTSADYKLTKPVKTSITEKDFGMTINLKPQQIRTFIVKLKPKE